MNAAPPPRQLWFEPLSPARLDEVLAIERRAHSHPWSRRNFEDSVQAGYPVQLLLGDRAVVGYSVAMKGVDEVHLLNLAVDPAYQRQGWAVVLLDALALWSRQQGAQWLWLEVRESNARAQSVYLRHGFARVGLRKDYYPAGEGRREHAVVMSLRL